MRALIQRVSQASVAVDDDTVGEIGKGLLVLLGVEKEDTREIAVRLVNRVLTYRVFPDEKKHMNRSLLDTGGALLLVSQFALVADTKKGTRPSFSAAAAPQLAKTLYDNSVDLAKEQCETQTGIFGADMQVSLTNDGPVTFLLES
ncbi:MAG TPA: D-tyrosyl-tRNA(Tyr) deacylase [Gammaproteobacteria bacterium]|nr:D-tyrosyl-tRNA(Tyr) deacylase [Gammaproteobacteria bacterium]|tara:strand:- start:5993 stop:6427 length:435 start_codon:yes stop_codon:yes gene_type:complete